MSESLVIEYQIKSDVHPDKTWVFNLDLSTHRCEVSPKSINKRWQKLENHQCEHCPYTKDATPFCLVANNLGSIAEYFYTISSIDVFDLEVTIEQEVHFKGKASAQRIASALIGLATSGSGCLYTQFLWPMLQQHIPMASLDDSVLRALSNMSISYVLNQPKMDFLELCKKQYQDMHQLNKNLSQRIMAISKQDSLNNGLTNLDMFIKVILYNLDHNFADLIEVYREK